MVTGRVQTTNIGQFEATLYLDKQNCKSLDESILYTYTYNLATARRVTYSIVAIFVSLSCNTVANSCLTKVLYKNSNFEINNLDN